MNTTKRATRRAAEALPVNVGPVERLVTALGGGLLTAYGLRRERGGWPLALLGGALVLRGATGRDPVYKTLGVSSAGAETATVQHAMTIAVEPQRLYDFWRDFENLPRIMPRLEEVRDLGGGRSRWVAKAPGGASVEWEAEVTEDHAPHLIAWRALPGKSQVWSAGEVRFEAAPGGRGTEVRVTMEYAPPAGRVGQVVAKLSGEEPDNQVLDSLRRLKMIFEAGEVATSAMRPEDDWEQGNQPWERREGDGEGPDQMREVGG
ncbi:MAG TPA: SRPBCC family protein [Chloroflexaceae bacterium]|nr:SRPBCC family protein [Chloroflexaceae bacterium]